MYFRLVLRVRAEPLPHKRHGVETKNFDAVVCQGQQDPNNLQKHLGVGVVEVPLV